MSELASESPSRPELPPDGGDRDLEPVGRPRGASPVPARRPGRADGLRVPPHNLGAEESLLGAMLLSKDAVAAAAEVGIAGADFYKPTHGHVFDAVCTLYARGEPVDPVTVAEVLERADLLDAVGGTAALVTLQTGTPATTSAGRYARIVEEHALLRRLIAVAGEIAESAYSRPDDVVKAVDTAEAMVYAVAQRRVTDSMAVLSDLLGDTLDRLEELYGSSEAVTGTPTGYLDLDELLTGLHPGQLIVVGARPAMGKTAFALGMAASVALDAGRPVVFFSLEMSQLEVSQRILCADARVDSKKVRTGRLNDDDWSKISHSVGRLTNAPLYIDDNAACTVMDIRAKARRLRSQVGDLGLVVVDYVQLMTGRSSAESRQVEVAELSRNLKILARELEVPVVALAQLNRQLESRADKRPMLSDLRESGSLEQDADVVMFLYRDEIYNEDSPDRGMAEIIVAKHRSGPVGKVRLAFLDQYTKFVAMARGV